MRFDETNRLSAFRQSPRMRGRPPDRDLPFEMGASPFQMALIAFRMAVTPNCHLEGAAPIQMAEAPIQIGVIAFPLGGSPEPCPVAGSDLRAKRQGP